MCDVSRGSGTEALERTVWEEVCAVERLEDGGRCIDTVAQGA